jgi:8-amino-7-oxononanoate synthase
MSEKISPNPNASSAYGWVDDELRRLEAAQLRRLLRVRESPHVGGMVQLDGRQLIDFGSNDYLGLAADARLIDAVRHATGEVGWGSAASPLVSGYGVLHRRLEQELAAFEHCEAALLFPTGFAANVAAVTTLAGPDDLILSDELNHASIIDGCRLSRARIAIYRHADAGHAGELIAAHQRQNPPRRILIVSDSLFSMDGDFAPLRELADLADETGAMLLVDEAHATGVWGERGSGVCEQLGVEQRIAVRIGTLSKGLGSLGGFAVGPQSVIEWIRNAGRSWIFSTAQPEAIAAASLAAIRAVQTEPQRRVELRERASWLRGELQRQGWDLCGSTSQIIPLRIGAAGRAVELAAQLMEAGFFVPAIRPPAVPEGGSRLRLSLRWSHTGEQLQRLVDTLGILRKTID